MAVENGAVRSTVQIIESEAIPVAYTAGRCRFYVKAAGEWGGSNERQTRKTSSNVSLRMNKRIPSGQTDREWTAATVHGYRPRVEKGVWHLSEVDLEFLYIGTYIMGCGGGGDPLHAFLASREMIRHGDQITVIDLSSLEPAALVGWGGGLGSPSVSLERLMGEEYNDSTTDLLNFMKLDKVDALAALEIGGANGMINLIAGASSVHDTPIVDGDFMGRAYPTAWQTTPNVYDEGNRGAVMLPASLNSGDGSTMVSRTILKRADRQFMTSARHHKTIDSAMRAACVDMGTHVGTSFRPQSAQSCQRSMIKNTVSMSWRLGRAVRLANLQGRIGAIGNILVDALGGPSTGKVLYAGKIIEVSRRVYKGHTIGEVVIAPLAMDDHDNGDGAGEDFKDIVRSESSI